MRGRLSVISQRPWLKVAVFLLCLVPLVRLVVLGLTHSLGANPIEFITRSTGTWTLILLLITLSVTPLRKFSGWHWLIKLRRMLGLFAFFYACLHFTTYIWLDQFFEISSIIKDVWKRPFITLGFASFLLLIPLAITSNRAMIERLGGKRWRHLHRLVYATSIGGVIHFWWLVKKDLTQPQIYALILGILLGLRLWFYFRAQRVQKNNALSRAKA